MKRNLAIRFKAIILLLIFSLSNLGGFACTMGLNQGHHQDDEHVQPEAAGEHPHSKKINELHSGHQPVNPAHDAKNDDCCKEELTRLQTADKPVPHKADGTVRALVITLLVPACDMKVLSSYQHTPGNNLFIRNHHPPVADTRIAIRSLLI